MAEDFFVCGLFLGADVIWIYIVINRKTLVELFRKLEDLTYGTPKYYHKKNKFLDFLVHFFCYYSLIVTVIFAITGLLDKNNCNSNKSSGENSKNVCGMMTNTWLPFDIDYSPMKEIVFALQVLSAGHCLYLGGCTVFSPSVCTELIVVKIQDFIHLLNTVFEMKSKEEMRRRLNLCIEYHKHIIELVFYFFKG